MSGYKDQDKPLVEHLTELRNRLLKSVICVTTILLLLLPFANTIYQFIAAPMIDRLPSGSSMIATEVTSPFLTPFKLTMFVAIFVSVPFIFYQTWSFITPGLYENEKKVAAPLLISSIVLFYTGTLFAYYAVFPLLFAFLAAAAPEGVQVMTDINHYLNFVLKMFFAFGLSFEIPIATFVLVHWGFMSVGKLAENRPYVILAAFTAGMLLTPPDVISQVLLAIPIWLLFEFGLILARLQVSSNPETTED